MAILLITSFYPFGTKESWLTPEINELKKYDQVFVCPRTYGGGQLPSAEINSNVINLRLITLRIIYSAFTCIPFIFKHKIISDVYKQSHGFWDLLKRIAVIPKGLYIARGLKASNIKHVHAYTTTSAATMAWVISKVLNVKFSFTVHTSTQLYNKYINTYQSLFHESLFVRTISTKTKSDLQNFIKTEGDKIKIIRLGVRGSNVVKKEKMVNAGRKFIVASVLEDYKGVDIAIEAIAILLNKSENLHCDIYGDGSAKDKLEKQALKHGLSERIKFFGHVPHNQLQSIFKQSRGNCLLVASDDSTGQEEGVPVTIMEALSNQIFVIATNNGAIPEIIFDRSSGFLIAQRDVNALAKAMCDYLALSEIELNEYAASSLEIVSSDYDVSKNALAFFESCIE